MSGVLVVGSANVDIVVRAPRRPDPGETVLADGLSLRPGGKGANQACAAMRAGAPARLVAAVGTDSYAEALLRGLTAAGVDVAACRRAVPTGCAVITVTPDGENSILVVPGANAALTDEDLDRCAAGAQAGCMLAQLEIPIAVVEHAAVLAARLGARFVLNASPVMDLPDALLAAADPLVGGDAAPSPRPWPAGCRCLPRSVKLAVVSNTHSNIYNGQLAASVGSNVSTSNAR
jgi:ribokinase